MGPKNEKFCVFGAHLRLKILRFWGPFKAILRPTGPESPAISTIFTKTRSRLIESKDRSGEHSYFYDSAKNQEEA
jgi:hypothetical protein